MDGKLEPYKGIAVTYEEIRPSYPEQLIEDIILRTGLNNSDRLLELGAGTGKATVQFAEKGFQVQAIEIGEDMAEILRKKCSDYEKVQIDVIAFEEWQNNSKVIYDMIYCAQAFHWLEPSIKYKKCHNLLKEEGYLVLFWYSPGEDNSLMALKRQDKINEVINRYKDDSSIKADAPQRKEHDGVYKEDERMREIEASGLFTVTDKLEYKQETKNDADMYIKTMVSVPSFAAILDGLEKQDAESMMTDIRNVIMEFGGYVSSYLNFSLYLARKKQHNEV